MKLSVFSDLACPWCYIGVTRLERALASYTLAGGEQPTLVFRAFQLDPDTPSDGAPLLQAIAEKFGSSEAAETMAAQVREAGRADGLDFDFERAVRANTYDAHRLLAWAEVAGGPGAQRDLAHELWRAHFTEGADIADPDTLAARAAACGLDADAADEWLATDSGGDEVRMQIETARSASISAVPTVVIEQRYAVRGAQSQETYLHVLRDARQRLRAD